MNTFDDNPIKHDKRKKVILDKVQQTCTHTMFHFSVHKVACGSAHSSLDLVISIFYMTYFQADS